MIEATPHSGLEHPVTAAVARLYEAFPYPRYPLLAKPRWQEGYLTSSLFAARLRSEQQHSAARLRGEQQHSAAHLRGEQQPSAASISGQQTSGREAITVLLGGSGEILPYVVRKWEPTAHHVLSLDLSRASLLRARLRLGWLTPRSSFVRADLLAWLQARAASSAPPCAHIDAYGVLHHMADPGLALRLLADQLAPSGTMRLMVYNSPARAWIHELQALLRLLHVSPFVPADRAFARDLIGKLARALPPLAERLAQVGSETLRNDARFVDTFLHAREARLELSRWGDLIANAGLRCFALFDRYAELDDLANPLMRMPEWDALAARAADGRFENNLELFLVRADAPTPGGRFPRDRRAHPRRLLLKAPPRLWFAFTETRELSLPTRLSLWHAFLRHAPIDTLASRLPRVALQRLARIGAILPGQMRDPSLRALALAPLQASMEPPSRPPTDGPARDAAIAVIDAALRARGRDDDARRRRVCLTRLERLTR